VVQLRLFGPKHWAFSDQLDGRNQFSLPRSLKEAAT
jgi:hypothetical protein